MNAPSRQFDSSFLHMIDIKLDDIELNIQPFIDEEQDDADTLSKWNLNYVEGYVNTFVHTTDVLV
jgi:hypothetical protein